MDSFSYFGAEGHDFSPLKMPLKKEKCHLIRAGGVGNSGCDQHEELTPCHGSRASSMPAPMLALKPPSAFCLRRRLRRRSCRSKPLLLLRVFDF